MTARIDRLFLCNTCNGATMLKLFISLLALGLATAEAATEWRVKAAPSARPA